MRPNSAVATPVPISTARCEGPLSEFRAASAVSSPLRRTMPERRAPSVAREATRLLHELPVPRLLAGQPLGEVRAGHEGRIERTIVHQRLPLGGFAHLLHQIDVKVDLI